MKKKKRDKYGMLPPKILESGAMPLVHDQC
jgi:hypothetical protein